MLTVYSSSLEKKMSLTFQLYDFDGDGMVTPIDTRTFLLYIDFNTFKFESGEKGDLSPKEGRYSRRFSVYTTYL